MKTSGKEKEARKINIKIFSPDNMTCGTLEKIKNWHRIDSYEGEWSRQTNLMNLARDGDDDDDDKYY